MQGSQSHSIILMNFTNQVTLYRLPIVHPYLSVLCHPWIREDQHCPRYPPRPVHPEHLAPLASQGARVLQAGLGLQLDPGGQETLGK